HARGFRPPSFRVTGLPLAWGRAVNGDEARTEAVQAREVLVAGRLVDGALAPELGLDRHDGDAVRFDPAVAAAFADQLVDEHALRRIRHAAALAAAALLGGAGLVVDDGGDALFLAQLTLHPVQRLSVLDPRVGRQGDVLAVLLWLVADDGDLANALGQDLSDHLRHGHLTVDRLATGHRDRVVVEDLVGHVRARGDRGADRQQAGVEVGAVANVLEDVRRRHERRLADPVGAFTAHVREGFGVPVHPLRHVVAADAGERAAAFGHLGRGVVRTAGAEIGRAHEARGVGRRPRRERIQPLDPLADAIALVEARDALV